MNITATSEVRRKPWSKEETETLIRLWDDVGSIVLLSVLLGRTSSSIQTHASRIGLPRRSEPVHRHRRRWSRSEERLLEDALDRFTDDKGKIAIYDMAAHMKRSVDAVTAKLLEGYASEFELLADIKMPDHVLAKMGKPVEEKKRTEYRQPGTIPDTRHIAKMRKCLVCLSPFWSEGAHNRICAKCAKAHESDEAYGDW